MMVRSRCRGTRSGLSIFGLIQLLHTCIATFHPSQNIILQSEPSVNFSPLWHQLGPFQIGTRESEWGSDPLERYGGFQNLKPGGALAFRSSLAKNGTVYWSTTTSLAGKDDSSVSLSISFPDVDWDMMQMAYGWAGLQFQAWIRGYFDVELSAPDDHCSLRLHIKQALEYWIDGEHYFGGDVYGYEKAPVVILLDSMISHHIIEIRAFNDIRMFGGRKPPRVDIDLVFDVICNKVTVQENLSVFPDLISGKAAGKFASVVIQNNGDSPVTVRGIQSREESITLEMIENIVIAPAQSRPVKLHFKTTKPISFFDASILYDEGILAQETNEFRVQLGSQDEPYSPHKYTYLHPSGIVSYGIIRAPSHSSKCERNEALPILLALHGAGVDTNSEMARNSFEALQDLCVWLIIPSGVTPWSGDDWHIWGMADVEGAVSAIQNWIDLVGWTGANVEVEKWFISGHSNGGQGAWYALINQNDRAIGGTPLAGYLSIPDYVPYKFWHEIEPRAASVLQSAMNAYRLDLLEENLAGTPILQGHGEADDNVPVYHSRRMFELLHDNSLPAELGMQGYHEFPGRGHWFDGIMTYGPIGEFLSRYLSESQNLPSLGYQFTITVGNPDAIKSRGGLRVLQLHDPSILGRIRVRVIPEQSKWFLETTNVKRFEVYFHLARARIPGGSPDQIIVDGTTAQFSGSPERVGFVFSTQWDQFDDEEWKKTERHQGQFGGLMAVYNSKGRFTVLHRSTDVKLASQYQLKATEISRNIFQYFSADVEIQTEENYPSITNRNVVILGKFDRDLLPEKIRKTFPISQFQDGTISFRLQNGKTMEFSCQPGMGLIFLFPLEGDERAGILIWGSDSAGLRRATRLFPIRTGVSQPDFILLGPDSGWKGASGALALGMFNSEWQIAEGSYFRNI